MAYGYRPTPRLLAVSLRMSRVPIHQAPSAGNLLLADPEHPNTWYLAGTHRLEPSVAIGSRSEIIRADRQHAASARARVRDRSHNARLVQGLVVVREDQGDHQANELTRRAIATSRSIRSEGLGLALAEAMMLSKPSIATAYSVQVSQIPRRFASGPAGEIPPGESIVERCWRPGSPAEVSLTLFG